MLLFFKEFQVDGNENRFARVVFQVVGFSPHDCGKYTTSIIGFGFTLRCNDPGGLFEIMDKDHMKEHFPPTFLK